MGGAVVESGKGRGCNPPVVIAGGECILVLHMVPYQIFWVLLVV